MKLNQMQIDTLLDDCDRAIQKNVMIRMSPHVVQLLATTYQKKADGLARVSRLKEKASEAKEELEQLKYNAFKKDEAIIRLEGETRILKHKIAKLSGLQKDWNRARGKWVCYEVQARCTHCGCMTFIGDLDRRCPYPYCPNCCAVMEGD